MVSSQMSAVEEESRPYLCFPLQRTETSPSPVTTLFVWSR